MPSKQFSIPGIGQVAVYKSRRSRHLRLSIKHDGSIRVSVPYWVTYAAGLAFAKSKADWLQKRAVATSYLEEGSKIGKAHRLRFLPSDAKMTRARTTANTIAITYPAELSLHDERVQESARKASIRALTVEANELLPHRLRVLAEKHNFTYSSVNVRQLKSRWGSCNNKQEITLSCFLMQLSWKEIDYVLLHELCHTKYMAHNKQFWTLMKSLIPDVSEIKKQLSTKRPIVINTDKPLMA